MRCRNFAAILVVAAGLRAQMPAPERPPVWMDTLQQAQQKVFQAPLGSLDQKVEEAWQSALQMPQSQYFLTAASMTSIFYQQQGYDLKAERVLRQAITAVPEKDSLSQRRRLNLQLVDLFESTQQLVKAVPIRESTAKQYASDPQERASEIEQLAHLYERMGELEKAESLFKEAIPLCVAQKNPGAAAGERISSKGHASFMRVVTGRNSSAIYYRSNGTCECGLAQFYERHGRGAQAEQVYKRELDNAGAVFSIWDAVAERYASFLTQQRRFDEVVKLTQERIARTEGSSNPDTDQTALFPKQTLAQILLQAGKADQALLIEQEAVRAAPLGSLLRVQALDSVAQSLIRQNRLEDAERTVEELRNAGAADRDNSKYHETNTLLTLAQIRDLQNKPEEAKHLRANAWHSDPSLDQAVNINSLVSEAFQAANRNDLNRLMAIVDQALTIAAQRQKTDFQEAVRVVQLVYPLGKKKEEARRVLSTVLQILEEVSPPDHPQ